MTLGSEQHTLLAPRKKEPLQKEQETTPLEAVLAEQFDNENVALKEALKDNQNSQIPPPEAVA